jgi:4-hydroxybenzoate polyprenyltransferase
MLSEAEALIMKTLSLFSVVRGYNIPVIILAIPFSHIYLAPEKLAVFSILIYFFLFLLPQRLLQATLSIIFTTAKRLINRPNKSMLDRLVSQKQLNVYFSLNFIVAIMAYLYHGALSILFNVYILHLVLLIK